MGFKFFKKKSRKKSENEVVPAGHGTPALEAPLPPPQSQAWAQFNDRPFMGDSSAHFDPIWRNQRVNSLEPNRRVNFRDDYDVYNPRYPVNGAPLQPAPPPLPPMHQEAVSQPLAWAPPPMYGPPPTDYSRYEWLVNEENPNACAVM